MGTMTRRPASLVRGADDITCVEFVDAASLYVDADLPVREAAAFAEHLARCVDCRAFISQFKATISLLAAGRAAQLTPSARDRILYAFKHFQPSG